MTNSNQAFCRLQPGSWLPDNHLKLKIWLDQLIQRSAILDKQPLDQVISAFIIFIDNEPIVRQLATGMFNEVPTTPPYNNNPALKPQIRTYEEMLVCINTILAEGPQWYHSDNFDAMGLIGAPISAILEWPMGTGSGYRFFRRPDVNAHWKAILDKWATFLSSEASAKCLNSSSGWTCPTALQIMAENGNGGVDNYTFEEMYECYPSQENYGFRSWDDYFTRKFRNGIRPVANPDSFKPSLANNADSLSVIVHACESLPYSRKENVKLHDTYWAKGQPYSLAEMLGGEEKARRFEGGQVYQAYLSMFCYHRWHAPLSGRVSSIKQVAGTYFSENWHQGFANIVDGIPRPDPSAPNKSQAYVAQVATRTIIHIQADNPKIGEMAIVFIGLTEISSCEFFVKLGDRVTKGQEIGTFHYGGSSHCLVFRPSVVIKWEDPGPYDHVKNNKKVNSVLAVVV